MTAVSISGTDLSERLQRCRQQQEAWARLSPAQRLRPVRALRRLLVAASDELCAAAARDVDKPAEETLACEIVPLADACRFLERAAARLLRPRRVPVRHRPLWLWGQTDAVHRRPRGLVGIIGTWNYPLFLNGVQIVQALVAGNGVLWKPSEVAPASARALFDLLGRAGFPPDLVQLLEATRAAGQELAEADVDHIVFTGSAASGRRLAETLGRRLVSSTLELSGCDALFVLDDADLALAARAVWFGATLNRGQTCLAVRRVFVPRERYHAFTDALAPLAAATVPQRLALPAQAELASRLVHEALADGARLLTPASPGDDGAADCFAPAVVLDARPEMALCREPTFAPVLAVLPYEHLADALQMDAQCPYGLGATIFTANPVRAERLAGRLRVGVVTVNEVIVPSAHPATPFGGRRDSGWGVTQGAEGLLEMTVPQVVSTSGSAPRPHYRMPGGVGPGPRDLLHGLLQWRHAATLRQRCRGLLQLLRGLARGDG
jgi:acyl-CoA reductase-like NAD-dependent aldehyde dehydrogenase